MVDSHTCVYTIYIMIVYRIEVRSKPRSTVRYTIENARMNDHPHISYNVSIRISAPSNLHSILPAHQSFPCEGWCGREGECEGSGNGNMKIVGQGRLTTYNLYRFSASASANV